LFGQIAEPVGVLGFENGDLAQSIPIIRMNAMVSPARLHAHRPFKVPAVLWLISVSSPIPLIE
jgi:hypothetical protein